MYMSLYALVSVDMHTCCCNVLVGRDCSTRRDAYKLLDGTRILEGEAAGPNGLGNGSRREVHMGIEFFFTIVGSEGGLGQSGNSVFVSEDRRHRLFLLTGVQSGRTYHHRCRRVSFLDCSPSVLKPLERSLGMVNANSEHMAALSH